MANRKQNVVVIGAGFAGSNVARGLRDAPVQVALFDRHNYHLFQPLLYQVATAALSPADIAFPIRQVFRKQQNVDVVLAEVSRIDLEKKVIGVQNLEIDYDYLVIAAGSTHSYFGHDEWRLLAPGLKTVDDAIAIRKKILLAFEEAEHELDEASRRAKLTFVIVGGGPTGVEMAGAVREIAADNLPRDFRSIDTKTARVILVEANSRLIKTFPEKLSARAKSDLEKMGVEIRLNSRVTHIDTDGLNIGDERLDAANIIWAAGVQASPLGKSLGATLDRAGRVMVQPDLSVPGHPEVFVVGDLASICDAATNQPVPGLAPAAMQMGTYVSKIIRAETLYGQAQDKREPFKYWDKGTMATIGKAKAVADIKGFKFGGFFAWATWCLVHVMFLVTFRSKVLVMLNWAWNYLMGSNGARLITGEFDQHIRRPRDVTPNLPYSPTA